MKKKVVMFILTIFAGVIFQTKVFAYPPAVGIVSKAKNCLVCHLDNGQWKDKENLIIDILDKETNKSLLQADGTFLIEVERGERKELLTVIGRKKEDKLEPPRINAWIYLDPQRIETKSLSKFAPGWQVNLAMSCRMVGDKLDIYPEAKITVAPMILEPGDDAQDGQLVLQVMLTKGESVKGKPKEGLISNYFQKVIKLKVK